jgi:restriction system protein
VSRLLRFSPAVATPAQFEQVVADFFAAAGLGIEDYTVTPHDVVDGSDGSYDFDATIRYHFLGMSFLVVVEAKQHSNPIRRQEVQVLQQKKESVGAHRAVIVSTARFQTGAVKFGLAHRIALVFITEGRSTYETFSRDGHPLPSREQALESGMPVFAGLSLSPGRSPGSTLITTIHVGCPDRLRQELLFVPSG